MDNEDLNLFAFDYDLTLMIFFLDAEGKVYARYGGRDAEDADNRQSLEGLRYTMLSVLDAHGQAPKRYAPRSGDKEKYVRELTGRGGGCMHCHQVKEALNRKLVDDGDWDREQIWRYPLPENLGMRLEVHRGNVVERVQTDSPAARAGIQPGDVVRQLGNVPIHSFGDAQYALDRAPRTGTLAVAWTRAGHSHAGTLTLVEGWRKTDVTWRPSMRRLIPSLPLYGDDLSAAEKKALGLPERRLAFRQSERVQSWAKQAGFQAGDIILGLEGRTLDLDVLSFLRYVQREFLVGDTVTVDVVRDGKRLKIPIALRNR